MKKAPRIVFIIFMFVIIIQSLTAQNIHDSNQKKSTRVVINSHDSVMVNDAGLKEIKKSHFEGGISYLNNDVYLGRKDSSVLPYFIPVLSYYHKSGLYFSVYLNYLKNSEESRIDLITLEAGYTFNSGNYDGQINVSKFVYNSQSTNVASEIQATVGYQNGFDVGFIKPTLEINLNFGSKIDYLGSFGLQHSYFGLHNKLEFTPTFTINGGTQNYYDSYYKNKRYSNSAKQKGQSGGTTVIGSVVNPSSFRILDYEASVPFSYTINNLVINFTPTYAVPLNPATININTKQSNGSSSNKTETENLSNSFYWSAGIVLHF
ncbi:MAG TPA: hypothetical protein VFI33_19890 [Puia sp.]|nr:hypothetical protein [Puia sp.]